MKIAIMVEGKTETAFMPHLREYLKSHLAGQGMPKLDPMPYDGPIPKGDRLKRDVERLLNDRRRRPADHVIALTDVYPDFTDAADAKNKMRQGVGREPRFHPHVALHEFEAWLLPYWSDIQRLAGHNRAAPGSNPETVNHDNPPAHRIQEIFHIGSKGKKYVKPRDAGRILRDNGLSAAVSQCAELKSLINTILAVCGASPIS